MPDKYQCSETMRLQGELSARRQEVKHLREQLAAASNRALCAEGQLAECQEQNWRMVDALRLIRYQSDAFDVAQVIEIALEGMPNAKA